MLNTSPPPRRLHRELEGAGDVLHMDEVAQLCAVLVDERRLPVQQAAGEDREHAGVGVRERLARPEDVEEPERHRLDPAGRREHHHEALLGVLGQRVDRGEVGALGLRRRNRHEVGAVGAARLPAPGLEIVRHAARGLAERAARRAVEPLAVDAHRGGDDDALHVGGHRRLHQHRRSEVVGTDVARDLVHALADAHLGGEVEDAVDAAERRPDRGGVADVAAHHLRPWRQGRAGLGAMHLLQQAVEHAHLVARGARRPARWQPMNPAPPVIR
jgi:hypothetical protein